MIWWQTEFVNAGGQLYGVEIHADAPSAAPAADGWASLADENPVIVSTDTVTPVKDFIQSSRAKVRLVVRSASELLKLYALADTFTNCVRILLKRNGVPVWGGYMDAEGVEVPKTHRTLFVSELNFGDFAPLKLVKFRQRGILSITDILARTVGKLGTPVKTDGAFLTSEPAREGLDTNLLGTDASLYDLLELVCMATVSTVRQWGVVRFDNPLRVKAGQDITKIYGDDNALRAGRVYNTIHYSLENPWKNRRAVPGEVRTITGMEEQEISDTERIYYRYLPEFYKELERDRPIERRGKYVFADKTRSADHTFNELKNAFGWAKGTEDKGYDQMKYVVPLTYEPNIKAQYLTDLNEKWHSSDSVAADKSDILASVESGVLHTFPRTIHISAPMRFMYPFAEEPDENAVSNTFYVTFLAGLLLKDEDGEVLFSYDGKAWKKGGGAYFNLAWRRGGLTNAFLDCEHPDKALERAKKNDGKWLAPEGLDVNIPVDLPEGCHATLNIHNVLGFASFLTFGTSISETEPYYYDYILTHWKEPGGYFLESLSLSQDTGAEDEEEALNVEAFVSPEVTENLDYTTKVSTYDKVPARIYYIGDLAVWDLKTYLRDEQHHWEVVFGSLYALYGVRGTELGLRIKGEPVSQTYTYDGRTYFYVGGSYDVRRDRCDVELIELNTKDTWNGQSI